MLQKVKDWVLLILLAVVSVLSVILMARKPKWIKEKEKEIEKADREVKINKAEIKKKDKQIEKAGKAVDDAKKEAAKAVQDYADLKKLHDQKIKKAGEDINVDKPKKYKEQTFDSHSDVADYFNDVISEFNGSGAGE